MLLDLMMPEMDGFELAKRIRMNPDFSECSMIMVSSAVRPGEADRCRQLGIDRYLTKPVVQSDLLTTILDVANARVVDEVFAGTPANGPPDRALALNVLLAEDSKVNQQVALGLLRMHGHEVEIANNGLEAIASLERRSFDVVLMDVQMGKWTGSKQQGLFETRRGNQADRSPSSR